MQVLVPGYVFSQGWTANYVNRVSTFMGHVLYDCQLLEVLFSKVGFAWFCKVKKAAYNLNNAIKMTGSVGSLHSFIQPAHFMTNTKT